MGPFSIVFLICVIFGLFNGWRNGWQTTLIRLFSFIGAYALLYLYLKPLAAALKLNLEFGFLLSHLAAGAGILVIGGFAISLSLRFILWLLKFFLPWRKPEDSTDAELRKPNVKSPVGALLGGSLGAVLSVFLVWALSLLSVQVPQLQVKPEQYLDYRLEKISQSIVGNLSGHLLTVVGSEDQDKAMMQAIIRNPVENAKRLRSIGESDSFKSLLTDRKTMDLVRSGDSKALLKNDKFQAVLQEPALQALADESGLQGADGDEALASTVSSAFTRMEQLRQNPKVMALVQDPELQRQIQNKDYFALFANPKFEQILEAFQSPDENKKSLSEQGAQAENQTSDIGGNQQAPSYPAPSTKIYHWVDEDGKHHYSDKEPD